MSAGSHRLRGRYVWPKLPDSLRVPTAFGLVSLTLDGVAQAQANLGSDGQLWLKARGTDTAESDRLELQVFRQLIDDKARGVGDVSVFYRRLLQTRGRLRYGPASRESQHPFARRCRCAGFPEFDEKFEQVLSGEQ